MKFEKASPNFCATRDWAGTSAILKIEIFTPKICEILGWIADGLGYGQGDKDNLQKHFNTTLQYLKCSITPF